MSRGVWIFLVLAFGLLTGTMYGQAPDPDGKHSAVGYVDCSSRDQSNLVPTYIDMCRREASSGLACGRSVTVLERRGRWLKIKVAEEDTRYIIARAVSQRADRFDPFYPASDIPNLGPPSCSSAIEHPTEQQDQFPRAIYAPNPEYSDKARKKKINGTVLLSLTVGTDGLPRDIAVDRGLGYGLDEKAVEAVQQWRFQPAVRDGQPVEKRLSVSVSFQLY